jgi:hypothetical protein
MTMSLIVEDFETRFNDERQREILVAIHEVLGGNEPTFGDATED